MSEAGVYTWEHTIGVELREPWRFVMWAFGAPRVYRVAYADPLAPGDVLPLYDPMWPVPRVRPTRPCSSR